PWVPAPSYQCISPFKKRGHLKCKLHKTANYKTYCHRNDRICQSVSQDQYTDYINDIENGGSESRNKKDLPGVERPHGKRGETDKKQKREHDPCKENCFGQFLGIFQKARSNGHNNCRG